MAEERPTVLVIENADPDTVRRVRDAVKDRCEVEGCDRPQTSRGLCTLHYARARKLAELDAKDRKGEARKVVKTAEKLSA